MSTTYISVELRRLVKNRANERCEYCHISEDLTVNGCEVDHIVAEKHGGATIAENLAYACFFCNRNKGSDLCSYKPNTQEFVRFFNPRIDTWDEHFAWDDADGITVQPLSDIGMVTVRLFGFNTPSRLQERRLQYNFEQTAENTLF
jgi:hypothetical protein